MNKANLEKVFSVTLKERIGPKTTKDAQLYNNNAYVYRFSKPKDINAAQTEIKIATKAGEMGIAPKIITSKYENGILMLRMEKMDGNLKELMKLYPKIQVTPIVKTLIGRFNTMFKDKKTCHEDIARNVRNVLYKINPDKSISLYLTDFSDSKIINKNSPCSDLGQLNYSKNFKESKQSNVRVINGNWYELPTFRFNNSPRTPGTPRTPRTPGTGRKLMF